jgi:hypothetical protein
MWKAIEDFLIAFLASLVVVGLVVWVAFMVVFILRG